MCVVGMAVSVSACHFQGAVDTADGPVKIMVGGLDKVIYLPVKLTEVLGHFADEGVEVELLSEPSGVNAETAMLAGDVHGVVGFYDHTIDLQTKGKCVVSVVQFADVPGEVEIVAADKADEIRSPRDFRRRRLGVTSPGSSTDFLTQYLASTAGLDQADYTTVKAGAGTTFISALESGGIDAGMTTDPTATKLLSEGKGKVLVEMRTVAGTRAALGGLYPAASVYMPCNWVFQHRNQVQLMARAFVRTLRWMKSHTAEEIAAAMPAEYAAGDSRLYVKAIAGSKNIFNSDGRMKAEGAANVLEVLAQASPSVRARKQWVDLTLTYTTEFVDGARS
jgi:NitT/TauT family transport system substrate-binding protein